MTLFDAGPVISLIDEADARHSLCIATLSTLPPPFYTTWPVIAEASHILGRRVGWRAQNALWHFVLQDEVQVVHLERHHMRRAQRLMEQYRDTPMDLADATLVVLAEERDLRRISTLDSDFHVYRVHGAHSFDVVPS